MELKVIAIALVILNIIIYSYLMMKIKKRESTGILKHKKLKLKKIEPIIAPPKSKVTWDEPIMEEDLDLYWKEETGKEEEKIEKKETAENDEERRVKLLWKSYMQKLDKFIAKLEKGSPDKYFEYYKEYENLDKFYSRFVFNFGLYLDEMEKNRASGRLGYCSTLLKEILGEV